MDRANGSKAVIKAKIFDLKMKLLTELLQRREGEHHEFNEILGSRPPYASENSDILDNDEILNGLIIHIRNKNIKDDDLDQKVKRIISEIKERISSPECTDSIIRVILLVSSFRWYERENKLSSQNNMAARDSGKHTRYLYDASHDHAPGTEILSSHSFFSASMLINSNGAMLKKQNKSNRLFDAPDIKSDILDKNPIRKSNNLDILDRAVTESMFLYPRLKIKAENNQQQITTTELEDEVRNDKIIEQSKLGSENLGKIQLRIKKRLKPNDFIRNDQEEYFQNPEFLNAISSLFQGLPSNIFYYDPDRAGFVSYLSQVNENRYDILFKVYNIGKRIYELENNIDKISFGPSPVHREILEQLSNVVQDSIFDYRKCILDLKSKHATLFGFVSSAVKFADDVLYVLEKLYGLMDLRTPEEVLEKLYKICEEEMLVDVYKRISFPYHQAIERIIYPDHIYRCVEITKIECFPRHYSYLGISHGKLTRCAQYLEIMKSSKSPSKSDILIASIDSVKMVMNDMQNQDFFATTSKTIEIIDRCKIDKEEKALAMIGFHLGDYIMKEWGYRIKRHMDAIEYEACGLIKNRICESPEYITWLKNWVLFGNGNYWDSIILSSFETCDANNLVEFQNAIDDVSTEEEPEDKVCSFVFDRENIRKDLILQCRRRLLQIKIVVCLAKKWWSDVYNSARSRNFESKRPPLQKLLDARVFFMKLEEYTLSLIHSLHWDALIKRFQASHDPDELRRDVDLFIYDCKISTWNLLNESNIIQENLSECIEIMCELAFDVFMRYDDVELDDKINELSETRELFLEILIKSNQPASFKLSTDVSNIPDLIFNINHYFPINS